MSKEQPEQVQNNRTTLSLNLLAFLEQVVIKQTTYSLSDEGQDQDIVRELRTCFRPSTWGIIKYFLEYGASSAWILRFKLGIAKGTVYESLAYLRGLGLIEAKTSVKPFSKRKRPAIIWALPNSSVKQVQEAVKLYGRLTSPLGIKAEKLGLKLIADLMKNRTEINEREIMTFLVSEKVPGQLRRDFFRIIAPFLVEEGYKVWKWGR